ncbi:hypothetical protein E3N88_01661 [Mikania micrantha]|uniref:Retrotransposon gag domain-containing protein n=1 Tax=Mikania micrantha TaxID=192012 RepID=A0A5N6Q1K6_9ASTR|nr:hypothetical protein E3N88_01661 [Mikania micrantha]
MWWDGVWAGCRLDPGQQSGELFYEAFKRFKQLLRTCPHHGISKWELITAFHDGLSTDDIRDVNSTTGGTFLSNPVDVDWDYLEKMAVNSKRQAQSSRRKKFATVKASGSSYDKVEKLERANQALEQELANLKMSGSKGGGREEEVNQVYGDRKQYDMNSNTYHSGLRNHPNFRYGNSSNQSNPNFQGSSQASQQYQNRQSNYNNQGYNQSGNRGYQRNYQSNQDQGGLSGTSETSNTEIMDLLKEMKKANEVRDKSVEALSKQVGQLAEEVAIYRKESGKLPSDTVVNPLHHSSNSKNTKNVHVENSKGHINVEARSLKSPNGLKKPPKHIKHTYEDGEFVKMRAKDELLDKKKIGETSWCWGDKNQVGLSISYYHQVSERVMDFQKWGNSWCG